MPNQPNIVFLSGAGATGKTTVARSLAIVCEDVVLAPSFTRECYAQFGFSSEAEAREDFDKYVDLQHHLLEHFPVFVNRIINANPEAKTVVFQRSPTCYAAHTVVELGSGLCVPFRVYAETMDAVHRRANTTLTHFPHPTPWALADDGFRNDDANRDSALEAEMLYMMGRVEMEKDNAARRNKVPVLFLTSFDLAARVNAVINHAGLDVKEQFRGKVCENSRK